MKYRDILKKGKGNDFISKEMWFDEKIPEYIYTKASLKKQDGYPRNDAEMQRRFLTCKRQASFYCCYMTDIG